MKSKISQAVLHSYKDIISVVILIIMTTALLMYFYGLQNMDMSIPFGYDGTDTMSSLVEAKMTQESGWNIYTDKLAAPYGYNNSNNLIIRKSLKFRTPHKLFPYWGLQSVAEHLKI